MTIQSADYTAFKQFATFQSIEELNLNIRRFLYDHSHELTNATINVLKTISHYSCKVIGVCWAKIDTLANTIGISRSSVERAIRILKQYGIITVQKTIRKTGGQGHNVYIISSYDVPDEGAEMKYRQSEEILNETSIQTLKSETETVLSKTKHSSRIKDHSNNVTEPTLEQLDASYTPKHIPQVFRDVCKPFLNAHDIYCMFGVVQSAKRYMKVLDIPMSVIIDAFKQSVFAYKLGKIKKSLFAYFFGTLCNQIAVYQRQQVEIHNWLEAESY
ncbi:helix-turn-helix domain-containing protein [Aneurinibacillus aneurinilyticus]|uniref:helix-turn-helix domain-containing protein n=1 Tax=Aneurinibacillus aneurinilyticus TaxID=1391 RepID=UPI003524601A